MTATANVKTVAKSINVAEESAKLRAYVETLLKSDDGKRVLNAALIEVTQADDGKLLTFSLPFMDSIVIRTLEDGTMTRSEYTVWSVAKDGKILYDRHAAAKRKENGKYFPTLKEALNSAQTTYGRAIFNAALDRTRTASEKTVRVNAAVAQVIADKDAALARAEQKIAEIQAQLAELLASK